MKYHLLLCAVVLSAAQLAHAGVIGYWTNHGSIEVTSGQAVTDWRLTFASDVGPIDALSLKFEPSGSDWFYVAFPSVIFDPDGVIEVGELSFDDTAFLFDSVSSYYDTAKSLVLFQANLIDFTPFVSQQVARVLVIGDHAPRPIASSLYGSDPLAVVLDGEDEVEYRVEIVEIPEPSSLMLAGIGALICLSRRRSGSGKRSEKRRSAMPGSRLAVLLIVLSVAGISQADVIMNIYKVETFTPDPSIYPNSVDVYHVRMFSDEGDLPTLGLEFHHPKFVNTLGYTTFTHSKQLPYYIGIRFPETFFVIPPGENELGQNIVDAGDNTTLAADYTLVGPDNQIVEHNKHTVVAVLTVDAGAVHPGDSSGFVVGQECGGAVVDNGVTYIYEVPIIYAGNIPEPASLALLGLGGLLLLKRSRN